MNPEPPEVDNVDESLSDRQLTLMAGATVVAVHVSFLGGQLLHIGTHFVSVPLRIGALVVVGVALIRLWMTRRPARSLPGRLFVVMLAPFVATFWINEVAHADQGRHGWHWEPFVGAKLLFFVIAALCPSEPRWLARALFAVVVAELAVLWVVTDIGSPGAGASHREPYITLAYALFAWMLFRYRRLSTRYDRALAVARAEAVMLRTTNEAFLEVRDMANTPVQNLEVALAILGGRQPSDPVVQSARRAAVRLRELAQALPVKAVTQASVDTRSLERIRALQNAERRPARLRREP